MNVPVKILSVDDEAALEGLLTQYFRRQIRKGEYEFYFARNGVEALKVLQENPDIEIVLSDINMPQMDGLTLLSRLNERQNPAMKCIMVSAYDDIGNIREAMNQGAFDFATKPIDLQDLNCTIEKAIKQVDFVHSTMREHHQLEALKIDLEVANGIQQSILPRQFPPFPEHVSKIDIAASMKPAKNIGGDFYDFFRFDDDTICFTIADVCGKGIPAALFMAICRTVIHAAGMKELSPAECLTHANDMLAAESADGMFVTVFYGTYNVNTGLVTYCNAGHNLPFVVHPDGRTEELPLSGNIMVGSISDIRYCQDTLQLASGDMLFLFTDGVTEAMNEREEMFGKSRLQAVLAEKCTSACQEVIATVLDEVNAFTAGANQSDDITMLALRRL